MPTVPSVRLAQLGKLGFAILFAVVPATFSQTHSTIVRDPQAVSVISRALSTAGGAAVVADVQDYTGVGAITYYWGGQEVQGSVTVKGRGIDQFRLDAAFGQANRSWAVSHGTGFDKNIDGREVSLPYHAAVNSGSLTDPLVYLTYALSNSDVGLSYLGLETSGNSAVYHVRLQRFLDSHADPNGVLSKLTIRDFYFDETTLYVVRVRDMLHPLGSSSVDYPHELDFSDYRTVKGAAFPFAITELINGQHTYSMQLTNISINGGLTDSDFQP